MLEETIVCFRNVVFGQFQFVSILTIRLRSELLTLPSRLALLAVVLICYALA